MLTGIGLRTPSLATVSLAGLAAIVLYFLSRCVYLLFFHPLAKYPGPKLAAVSKVWQVWQHTTARQCFIMEDIHRKYGDVVRVGPNALSFVTPESYLDIYGHATQGKKRFLKSDLYGPYHQHIPRISTARDPAVHSEQRRTLSHAFSARALRDQETVVHHYINMLLEQFGNIGANGEKPVNVTAAWNWLTFDIIGDLAYGEPFGCLAEGSSHWVGLMFGYFRYWVGMLYTRNLGPLGPICLRFLFPKNLQDSYNEHVRLHGDKARRRIARGSMERIDFFDHLIRNHSLTEDVLIVNGEILLLAGSETTATALAGLTWYLLKNPACLAKLTDEIRGAFGSLDQITGDATAPLPYLHGCIEEGMRVFPPTTLALPRESPGAVIDGVYVPAGVVVANENYAMARDPRSWVDPLAFRPERWVGEGLDGDDRRASQPFSTGPRACLGINLAYLEMRVTVAKMLWAFDLELVSDIEDWNRACGNYLLWQKPDLQVKFHPRVMV